MEHLKLLLGDGAPFELLTQTNGERSGHRQQRTWCSAVVSLGQWQSCGLACSTGHAPVGTDTLAERMRILPETDPDATLVSGDLYYALHGVAPELPLLRPTFQLRLVRCWGPNLFVHMLGKIPPER